MTRAELEARGRASSAAAEFAARLLRREFAGDVVRLEVARALNARWQRRETVARLAFDQALILRTS